MSQLNLKQILSGDDLSTVMDKLNYNFDQIVLNGGGPQGLRGLIGAPGLPGLQGKVGTTGSTGPEGTHIYAYGASPSTYPFGTGGEILPRNGDIFLEANVNFLNLWELSPTGTGFWNLVQTISSPSSGWSKIYHQSAGVGPDYTDLSNNPNIAGKLFVGSTAAYVTGADPDSRPYLLSSSFVDTLVSSMSVGNPYGDSLSTFASVGNQLRLISIGLSGATGSLGGIATFPASILTNRGGVIHTMEAANTGSDIVQIYRIQNADTLGEKFFSLGMNNVGSKLLYGDMLNRAGIGTPEFEQLVAGLSVAGSLAVGSPGGFYNTAVFNNSIGSVIEGNLAVGVNQNTFATGTFYGSTASSLLIDTNASPTPNYSYLRIGSSNVSPYTDRSAWTFFHDAYKTPVSQTYGSLSISGYNSWAGGTGATSSVLWLGITGDASGNNRPLIGVNNTNPYSLFEIGSGFDRISIGEAYGASVSDYMANYIGFNLHKSPTYTSTWIRRGDGAYNTGRAIWTNQYGGINFSYVGSTGGGTASLLDTDVVNSTRFTLEGGSLRASDTVNTHTLYPGPTGIGAIFSFGATGTSGSGNISSGFRRTVAVFGDASAVSGTKHGSPLIATTNGLTQSISTGYGSNSVLPQYTFWNADTTGLYLAQGSSANTTTNGGKWTPSSPALSIGIAIGGTSAISVHGDNSSNLRIGINQLNPLEMVHIGNRLTIEDAGNINYNAYWNGTDIKRIYGSTASGSNLEGFGRIMWYNVGTTSGTSNTITRFRNTGTVIGIEVAGPGTTGATNSTNGAWNSNYKMYRGMMISPPLQGPSASVNYSPYTPQVSIGLPLDVEISGTGLGADSSTAAKRGTLALATQARMRPGPGLFGYTFEDLYAIGLYGFEGYPVAGIGALGGNPTSDQTRSVYLNFMGASGNFFAEDATIMQADTALDIGGDTRYTRRITFGPQFRVGINHTPVQMAAGSPLAGNFFNIASLVVAGDRGYYSPSSSPEITPAIIAHGSIIVDSTTFGGADGGPDGLFFRCAGLTGSPAKTGNETSDSYPGDWGINYVRQAPGVSGLNFWRAVPGGGDNYLWLDDSGGVGVGTTGFTYTIGTNNYKAPGGSNFWIGSPSAGTAKLSVAGWILGSGIVLQSDRRVKENVIYLDTTLQKILQLNPASYNRIDTPGIPEIGFIAQEVMEIFPEVVRIKKDDKFEDGLMMLDYNSFAAILTKGIQEQQAIIEEKDKQIKNLEEKLSRIEAILTKHNLS